MEIGGIDVTLPGPTHRDDIVALLKRAALLWPLGFVQLDPYGKEKPFPLLRAVAPELPCTFFVYRNEESFKSWDEFGLTPENEAEMFNVTVEEDCICLVAGNNSLGFAEDLLQAVADAREPSPLEEVLGVEGFEVDAWCVKIP